jgi:3-dehydroquinate synthase
LTFCRLSCIIFKGLHRIEVKVFCFPPTRINPSMAHVRVDLREGRDRSYTVDIRPGLLVELPGKVKEIAGSSRIFVITDSKVARLYGRQLMRRLASAGLDVLLLEVAPGEQTKDSRTLLALQSRLLHEGVSRSSLIVALGGGVIGDLAGFVAATVLRGIRFVQVPTTLLAQVDSSVGGKVGVDHETGKNLLGAFHQPVGVFIDPLALRTLPVAEFRNGMAEVVKVAASMDAKFFARLEKQAPTLSRNSTRELTDIVASAVGLKAAVVSRDETEAGLRKILNLGHTLGHAFEASSDYRLKHGYAVAAGMAAESRLALALGVLRENDYRRLAALLRSFSLPIAAPRVRKPVIFEKALALDKKGVDGDPRFVLLKGIGSSAIGVRIPMDLVRKEAGLSSINKRKRP